MQARRREAAFSVTRQALVPRILGLGPENCSLGPVSAGKYCHESPFLPSNCTRALWVGWSPFNPFKPGISRMNIKTTPSICTWLSLTFFLNYSLLLVSPPSLAGAPAPLLISFVPPNPSCLLPYHRTTGMKMALERLDTLTRWFT